MSNQQTHAQRDKGEIPVVSMDDLCMSASADKSDEHLGMPIIAMVDRNTGNLFAAMVPAKGVYDLPLRQCKSF